MTEPVVTIEDGVKRYGTKLALNRVQPPVGTGHALWALGPPTALARAR